jgi:DNA modification methylase
VEVEFYNRDARDVFLSPKSVDLFISHPPYFAMMDDERYGGDSKVQIHHVKDQEAFSDALIKYINNMADALKDDGNILLIVPNFYHGIIAIADVLKGTNLFIDRVLIWNIVKKIKGQDQPLLNLILQIRKNKDYKYKIKGLDSLIIDLEWVHSDVVTYQNIGFIGDALPVELTDILVNAFSEEGDTVADLFGGTGTVAISSLKNNRKAIYNDASIDQFDLAKKRVYDTLRVIPDNERQEKMIKDEVVNLMLESINKDNRELCKQGGMSESDIELQIQQSQLSLALICSNLYDKLKNAQIITTQG